MDGRLVHFAQLPIARTSDGRFTLTQKFIEGMASYAKLWDGPVRAVLPLASRATHQLDNVCVHAHELPFELEVVEPGGSWLEATRNASIVLSGLSHELTELPLPLRNRGIALVYVTELSLRTRLQIVQNGEFNSLSKLRKMVWEANRERQYLRAIAQAAGLQANGTPSFRAYQTKSPNPLLFFDSRASEDHLPSAQQLAARFAARRRGRQLRLVFSGRLTHIKGVQHLVPFAHALRSRNVAFTLDVFGAGECEPGMRDAIRDYGLEAWVRLRGSVDFDQELMRQVRDNYDVFVCCHRQGDPSCTYLETFSLGVPILGYANEALTGILEHVEAGRVTPVDDVERLASSVEAVSRDDLLLEAWSRNALNFARQHTFERTSERRIDHVRRLLEQQRRG